MTYPDDFLEYWKTTAMRDGMRLGKRNTFKFWKREIEDGAEPEELLRASKAYTRHHDLSETFANPKDPERFLSQGLWEDFADIPEPIEMVKVSDPEIARAYWTEQDKPFMLAKLDSNWPPEFCFVIPKTFAEQFESDRLSAPVSKGGVAE